MIDIKISAAPSKLDVTQSINMLYDTKLRDFPAYTKDIFRAGFSASDEDMGNPLWAFLDMLETVDQGLLILYLADAIRTN